MGETQAALLTHPSGREQAAAGAEGATFMMLRECAVSGHCAWDRAQTIPATGRCAFQVGGTVRAGRVGANID